MRVPDEIFKAYDIRGIVDETLTEDLVCRIGQALGSWVLAQSGRSVVIGRDGRLSGARLSAALTAGLRSTGCHVVDVRQVPTPALYFATREFGIGTAVQLTGSHNPPPYNGLKMMLEGEPLHGEAIQSLRERVLRGQFPQGQGGYASRDILERYCQRILADVHLTRSLHLVIDCGNGVAGLVGRTDLSWDGLSGDRDVLRGGRDVSPPSSGPQSTGESDRLGVDRA